MEIKISDNELGVLRKILNNLVIKSRTGEIRIIHGADRFVSTNNILKKEEIEILEKVFNKTGLSGLKKI
jgi:hypothetical protein